MVTFTVSSLAVVPQPTSARLSWNNPNPPANSTITGFSINVRCYLNENSTTPIDQDTVSVTPSGAKVSSSPPIQCISNPGRVFEALADVSGIKFTPSNKSSFEVPNLVPNLRYEFNIQTEFELQEHNQAAAAAERTVAGQITTPSRSLGNNADGDDLADSEDPDDDNDGTLDAEDTDDDNDGVIDPAFANATNPADNCPTVPNANQENYDRDSQGDACDIDNDNDGVYNLADGCDVVLNTDDGVAMTGTTLNRNGVNDWVSNSSVDADIDGCRDEDEDRFLNAEVFEARLDPGNLLAFGEDNLTLSWTNPVRLYSWNISAVEVRAPRGISGINGIKTFNGSDPNISLEYEASSFYNISGLVDEQAYVFGFKLRFEGERYTAFRESTFIYVAADDDNDGLRNPNDACDTTDTSDGWTSNSSSDYDSDGCRDGTAEETDDDNDRILNTADSCPQGQLGWTSNPSSDYDSDGCRDGTTEETDDDNDGVLNTADNCPAGLIGGTGQGQWIRVISGNGANDRDDDGCRDEDEDTSLASLDITKVSFREASSFGGDGLTLTWVNPGRVYSWDISSVVLEAPASILPGGRREFNVAEANISLDYGGISTYNIRGLTAGASYSFSVYLRFDNGRVTGAKEDQTIVYIDDNDGDGIGGVEDVDADGDGLIEIYTATQLDWVRNDLLGSSRHNGTSGSTVGCGNGRNINTCNGYELMNDIDLMAAGFSNWEPIGFCSFSGLCEGSFVAIFEGNNYAISNLTISKDTVSSGIGLFAAANTGGEIRNLRLLGVDISSLRSSSSGGADWGALLGLAANTLILNVSVEGGSIIVHGISRVGGLVGQIRGLSSIRQSSVSLTEVSEDGFTRGGIGGLVGVIRTTPALFFNIESSTAEVAKIAGINHVGGLVGWNEGGDINSSSFTGGNLFGTDHVGGLVGYSERQESAALILSSFAQNFNVKGTSYLGGLVGYGQNIKISKSYASFGSIRSGYNKLSNTGGLIGAAENAQISSSYAHGGSISSELGSHIGGFAGIVENSVISSSFAAIDQIKGFDEVGGMLGDSSNSQLLYSYAAAGSVNGTDNTAILVGSGEDLSITASLGLAGAINASSSAGSLVSGQAPDLVSIDSTYWDKGVTFVDAQLNYTKFGTDKSRRQLQAETNFAGIYEDWDEGWCDVNDGDFTQDSSSSLATNAGRVWDLGGINDYPTIRCLPLSPAQQRSLVASIIQQAPTQGRGITDLSAIPSSGNVLLSWINPDSPSPAISQYEIVANGFGNIGDQTPTDTQSQRISYSEDGRPQSYLYTGLTDGLYYQFVFTRVGTNQVLARTEFIVPGINTDGDDLADSQDDDKDNDLVINNDNCPTISNYNQMNTDSDAFGDACDVDADGDGLIEISSAAELNMIRQSLSGASLGSNTDGCGRNNGDLCTGYELSNDISLLNHGNWAPVGGCTSASSCANLFNTVFAGNNHSISGLLISEVMPGYGVGLFGALGSSAVITELVIKDAELIGTGGGEHWGILAGYANGASIRGVAISGGGINTNANSVGGMLGSGRDVTINSSVVHLNGIRGGDDTGGIVGDGTGATVHASMSVVKTIGGGTKTNALLGLGTGATVLYSYAVSDLISGSETVSGLLGGTASSIVSSYWNALGTFSASPADIRKTRSELRNQVSYAGDFTDWDNAWCNINTGEFTIANNNPGSGFTTIWDLGKDNDYPVLNCLPLTVAEQRSAIYKTVTPGNELALQILGINDLAIAPSENEMVFSWTNPQNSLRAITGYSIDAQGFDRDRNSVGNPHSSGSITYSGDGMQHNYALTGLTSGLYYDFSFTIMYDGGTMQSFDVATARLVGANSDGDEFADAQDIDSDNDGVPDDYDDYPGNSSRAGDRDSDGIDSVRDVDLDGDGLIEVYTATQLDWIRNDLLGSSRHDGTVGNTDGCGDGGTINTCKGYELMNDIDLVVDGFVKWEPIGFCTANNVCPASFEAIFEGNNHAISNLAIRREARDSGIGFFAASNPTAEFRNLRFLNVDISSNSGGNDWGVLLGLARDVLISDVSVEGGSIIAPDVQTLGGLVGDMRGAREIRDISVSLDEVTGRSYVGGIIGVWYSGTSEPIGLRNSTAEVQKISATNINAGGLIGWTQNGHIYSSSFTGKTLVSSNGGAGGVLGWGQGPVVIASSHASLTDISSPSNVGGLIGLCNGCRISSSGVEFENIQGGSNSGGFIGSGASTTIINSSTKFNSIVGSNTVGGFIGNGQGASVDYSSARFINITGENNLGGLAGSGIGASVGSSYVNFINIAGRGNTGGLIGFGENSNILSSYASFFWVNGTRDVGGLVGEGGGVNISLSYAAGNEISGFNYIGGLVGRGASFGGNTYISISGSYSILNILNASDDNAFVDGLIGDSSLLHNSSRVSDSYWLDSVKFTDAGRKQGNAAGSPVSALTTPASFSGIYANWGGAWCSPGTGNFLIASSAPSANYVNAWNLDDGESSNGDDYPVLNCLADRSSSSEQRETISRVLAGQAPLIQ